PESEDASRRQSKEQPIHHNDVAQNLFVRAEQQDNNRNRALKSNSENWNARARIEPRKSPRKHSVCGHRKIQTRIREHRLAEESHSRQSNQARDERGTQLTKGHTHYLRRWRRSGGEDSGRKRLNVDKIHREIQQNDAYHSEDKRPRQIFPR